MASLPGLGGMKRETLRSPMSMPSLSNSPWILGAPQALLAVAIWRMSCLTSAETSRSAGRRAQDLQRQKRRKPARCQRTTVSGFTTMRASAQRDQTWESSSQKARPVGRSRGRGADQRRSATCWRRARFHALTDGGEDFRTKTWRTTTVGCSKTTSRYRRAFSAATQCCPTAAQPRVS